MGYASERPGSPTLAPAGVIKLSASDQRAPLPVEAMPRVLLAFKERSDLDDIVGSLLALRLLPFVAQSFPHARSMLMALRMDMLVLDPEMFAVAADEPTAWRPHADRVAVAGPAADPVPADVDVLDPVPCHSELSLFVRETLTNRRRGVLRRNDLEIDLRRREARWRNRRLEISPLQLRLLTLLVEADGAVLTKVDLARRLFGNASAHDERIETHVRRIRRRLGAQGGSGVLVTVRGEGYRVAD